MADSPDTTDPCVGMNLLVSFRHEGVVEATMVVISPGAALTAALLILATRDALYPGDLLSIETTVRPNLIQRGLA